MQFRLNQIWPYIILFLVLLGLYCLINSSNNLQEGYHGYYRRTYWYPWRTNRYIYYPRYYYNRGYYSPRGSWWNTWY